MVYAIISDIHGNYPAFKAVINDAKSKGAEAFFLLGDYIRDSPFHNVIIEEIRNLPRAYAVLGNGELGILSFDEAKPKHCEFDQMLPNFSTYISLSKDNLDYLKALKESLSISLPSKKLAHLSHSIGLVEDKSIVNYFNSNDYALEMEKSPFSWEEGNSRMQALLEDAFREVSTYPGDISIFGHNHLQFLGEIAGKIFLNPGSCGMPMDYDSRAPYAIIKDDGKDIEIELHRVEYDVEEIIEAILEFNDFNHALFWNKLRAAVLKISSAIPIARFWQHAKFFSGGIYPMDNRLWDKAVKSFEFEYDWSLNDWKEFAENLETI